MQPRAAEPTDQPLDRHGPSQLPVPVPPTPGRPSAPSKPQASHRSQRDKERGLAAPSSQLDPLLPHMQPSRLYWERSIPSSAPWTAGVLPSWFEPGSCQPLLLAGSSGCGSQGSGPTSAVTGEGTAPVQWAGALGHHPSTTMGQTPTAQVGLAQIGPQAQPLPLVAQRPQSRVTRDPSAILPGKRPPTCDCPRHARVSQSPREAWAGQVPLIPWWS